MIFLFGIHKNITVISLLSRSTVNPCYRDSEASHNAAESLHPASPADHIVEHEICIAGGLYTMSCLINLSDQLQLGTTNWITTFNFMFKMLNDFDILFYRPAVSHWDHTHESNCFTPIISYVKYIRFHTSEPMLEHFLTG